MQINVVISISDILESQSELASQLQAQQTTKQSADNQYAAKGWINK